METLQWIRKEAITQRVIIALNEHNMEEFIRALINADMSYTVLTDYPSKPWIYIDYSDIQSGFYLEDERILVFTEKELYQYRKKKYRYDNKFSKANL
ncbi:hypothetical protein MGH68_01225 [Erysipelothrix sp. D19-032]